MKTSKVKVTGHQKPHKTGITFTYGRPIKKGGLQRFKVVHFTLHYKVGKAPTEN